MGSLHKEGSEQLWKIKTLRFPRTVVHGLSKFATPLLIFMVCGENHVRRDGRNSLSLQLSPFTRRTESWEFSSLPCMAVSALEYSAQHLGAEVFPSPPITVNPIEQIKAQNCSGPRRLRSGWEGSMVGTGRQSLPSSSVHSSWRHAARGSPQCFSTRASDFSPFPASHLVIPEWLLRTDEATLMVWY